MLTHGKGYISFESKDEKHILKISTKKILLKFCFRRNCQTNNNCCVCYYIRGIVGGDKLDIIVKTCKKSEVQLYQQAAEKVYKNHKKPSIINISLTSEEGYGRMLPKKQFYLKTLIISKKIVYM